MGWLVLAFVTILLVWFVQRFVFAPHYTEPARHRFVLETLRHADHDILRRTTEKTAYSFRGRTLGAHWIAHPRPDIGPTVVTVEFDVCPTVRTALSISRSTFVLIRDAKHLENIKTHLKTSDNYEPYCVYPRTLGPPPTFDPLDDTKSLL